MNIDGRSEFERNPWQLMSLELGERVMLATAWENHAWGNKAAFLTQAWS